MPRHRILGTLLLGAALALPLPAGAAPEEWVVAVGFGHRALAHDLLVLREGERFFLPLAEFAALLKVPVERTKAGVLEGTVSSTGRKFRVDPESRRYVAGGSGGEIAEGDMVETADGIFLSETLIGKLIGIELGYDQRAVALMVSAEDPLPIEVFERQEQMRERLNQPKDDPIAPVRHDVPYTAFSPPMGDVDLFATRRADGSFGFGYDTLMSAEIGYVTGFLFARGDETEPLQDARVTFGRESYDGGVFGVDPLTEAWAGDVRRPVVPLVGGGELGPGVLMSSLPLDRPDDFDMTTVDGDAQPGWDVELYQNSLLIDFQQVGQDGRYRFEDVPLLYGMNRFRLVFYGPQGQIREEVRHVNIGNMALPGETLFRGYAGLPGQRLLAPVLPGEGTYDDVGFSAEIEHGFSKHLSASAFAARAPVSRETDSDFALYAGAGASVSWKNFAINADLGLDDSGGYALDLGAAAEFSGIFLTGRHARFFNGFESIVASEGLEPLDSLSTLRANTWLSETPVGPLSLSLRGEHKDFASGRDRYEGGADLRHSVGPVHLNHGFSVRHEVSDFGGPSVTSMIYEPAFSFGYGDLWARGTTRINLSSGETFESASGSARYRVSDDITVGAGVSYSPMSDSLNVSASYSHRLSFGAVSLSASGNNDGDFTVGLGLTFSFGFDNDGTPYMTSDRLAQSGSVSPFVYLDRDADGRFDAGRDEPLPGVGLKLGTGARPDETTGQDGNMVLASLATSRPVVLDVDRATLEDPFWVPAAGPVEMRPRAGRTLPVGIAVVEGGEVSGHVTAQMFTEGQSATQPEAEPETLPVAQPVAGVEIELVGGHDRVLARTRSLRDGFYLFEGVPPGDYRVRVRPGQKLGERPIEAAARPVSVAPGGDIIDAADLAIRTSGLRTSPGNELGGALQ